MLNIGSAGIKGEALELAVGHRRVEWHEPAAQGVMSIDPKTERGSESIGIKIGGHLEGTTEP
ncbi:putative alpha-1,2-mannosidase [Zymobacter palmae]|uniref:Putative alpha-1,2-mannosidase n=1 Tax=Zymobacter palmae TaxID=33074 RepID=A0A348HFB0_9GAMM|nr:putative alpha-1,2-mannosidase [Zymobacter palmae]